MPLMFFTNNRITLDVEYTTHAINYKRARSIEGTVFKQIKVFYSDNFMSYKLLLINVSGNEFTYPMELQSLAKCGFWISPSDIFEGTEKKNKKLVLEQTICECNYFYGVSHKNKSTEY